MRLQRQLVGVDACFISGCTCTLCYLRDNELFVANLGDTQYSWWERVTLRAFLISDGGFSELTVVHNAIHDQERIRQAGGWITSSGREWSV